MILARRPSLPRTAMAYPTHKTGRTMRSRLLICPAMTINGEAARQRIDNGVSTARLTGCDGYDKREG